MELCLFEYVEVRDLCFISSILSIDYLEYFGLQDWCFVSSILEYCLFGVFWSTRLVFCKQYFGVMSFWSILEYKTSVL